MAVRLEKGGEFHTISRVQVRRSKTLNSSKSSGEDGKEDSRETDMTHN